MDPERIQSILSGLGIKNLSSEKVALVMELATELGKSIDMPPEEYLANVEEESFYLPKVEEGFYFNPNVFRQLHSIDYAGLRKLVMPDLRRLRR